jgi:hypothetical protein
MSDNQPARAIRRLELDRKLERGCCYQKTSCDSSLPIRDVCFALCRLSRYNVLLNNHAIFASSAVRTRNEWGPLDHDLQA